MPKPTRTAYLKEMDAQMRKDLGPAEVVLDVTGFQDVLAPGLLTVKKPVLLKNSLRSGRGTTATMTMNGTYDHVWIDDTKPNTLVIQRPGATVRFTVTPDGYYPVGIAFLLLAGVANPDDEQRLGLLNFDQSKIRRFGHVLYFTDVFLDKNADHRYKFSVIIQRASDGALGIIDPEIVHVP